MPRSGVSSATAPSAVAVGRRPSGLRRRPPRLLLLGISLWALQPMRAATTSGTSALVPQGFQDPSSGQPPSTVRSAGLQASGAPGFSRAEETRLLWLEEQLSKLRTRHEEVVAQQGVLHKQRQALAHFSWRPRRNSSDESSEENA
mmetsp:Transcript_59361/g.130355  ORF Transcript_59361/g.130355 Transcript_59361/m.130355 type:complete len:145 (-) Transcript_59361:55-489(-)